MRCWAAASAVVAMLICVQSSAAQDAPAREKEKPPQPSAAQQMAAQAKSNGLQPMAATPVLVVMEAAGGVRAGAALRGALNSRNEVRVVSQSDLVRKSQTPAAVITVSAVTAQLVSVAYWDMTGARDVLSAQAPAQADQLDAVVLALASALLARHRDDLLESSRRTSVARDFSPNASELYAMLGRFSKARPRSNVSLRYEDF